MKTLKYFLKWLANDICASSAITGTKIIEAVEFIAPVVRFISGIFAIVTFIFYLVLVSDVGNARAVPALRIIVGCIVVNIATYLIMKFLQFKKEQGAIFENLKANQ